MESFQATIEGADQSAPAVRVEVAAKFSGMRLDQFLALVYPAYSRSLISASVGKDCILVNGGRKKCSYRLRPGDLVHGLIEQSEVVQLTPEKIDFTVLFEDDHLLMLSKPPGLVVHPGSGNPSGTLVNGLLYYCTAVARAGDGLRPGIVHRLDKDTSGLMVVAKTDAAHRVLTGMFKEHRLTKEYLTIVHGIPEKSTGRIVAAIGRHPVNRQKMAVREVGGRHAATSWELLDTLSGNYSLLKVEIETGRTHQIRVHLAHLGFPVAGDQVYGRAKNNDLFSRQMLHAWRLSFAHPVTAQSMSQRAPLWPDFQTVLSKLRTESHGREL